MRIRNLMMFLSVLALAINTAVMAGSLEPSAPPAGTMKSLDQVEPRKAITSLPYTISTSGSYYLVGNLTLSNINSGINIDVDNVTIDLCGFTLDGNKLAAHGILGSNRKNIVIKNGNVINWYGHGIAFFTSTNCTVENISLNNIGLTAIQVSGNSSVSNCKISGNRATNYAAINASSPAIIKNCVVADGNYIGINVSDRATVIECVVKNNKNTGIYAAIASVVKDCVSTGNSEYGIRVSNGSIVSGCAVSENGNHGIYLESSTAINNHCRFNGSLYPTSGAGIFVYLTACRVEGNTANNNFKYGFSIGNNSNFVVRNFARGNGSPVTNYSNSGGGIGTIVTAMTTTDPWANFSF